MVKGFDYSFVETHSHHIILGVTKMVWKTRKLGTVYGLWAYGNCDGMKRTGSLLRQWTARRWRLVWALHWYLEQWLPRKASSGFQAHSLTRSEKGGWEKWLSSGESGTLLLGRPSNWRYTAESEGGTGVWGKTLESGKSWIKHDFWSFEEEGG